ncbi:carbohydrate ABC transporter permease [Paenibacillus hamazuiensis]|uniref:carbohydrate ABC transporter permease n=1 Tax=Paenibacillus hamazuiensis TaxID=2936508 RepID=UPI00200C826E
MKRATYSRLLLELAAVLLACCVIVPFAMICIGSVKNVREAALFSLSLPTEWAFGNYAEVVKAAHIGRGFFNSFFISGLVVLSVAVCASMAAFVIQRRNDRLLRAVYYLFIMGLIVPASIIPTIKLMMDLHIHNTYPGIVLYYTSVLLPFSVFLLTGFMKSVPRELDESAVIDGCGFFRLYVSIVLPLLISVLVTVTIVVMMAVWNDFFGPFYLITDSTKWTIILSVYSFVTQYNTNWGLVFAFMVMVISPVLVIYLFLQKYIIEGLTAGSLKG